MQSFSEKVTKLLLLIRTAFGKLGNAISSAFLKIFPKRAAKYFDADRHEVKYILNMALYALVIDLYIETFARLSAGGILEGFRWAITHPVIFLYNVLIIFCTMTFALLFRRRRFAWFIISVVWIVIGTANGMILLSRMTPFTLYDLQNFADGLTIATTYYSIWQLVLAGIALVLFLIALIMIFLRSEKWKNIRYPKSIAAIVIALAVTFGAGFGLIRAEVIGTFFGNLNYAYRDYGMPYCFILTSANAGISRPSGYSEDMMMSILDKTKKGKDTVLETKNDSTDHPNIIVLQMESFTVAQDYSNIEVDRDPTPVFNKLSKEYSSGKFIVPACGAGTANTEFEVLTGISAKYFGPGEYPYKGKLRKNTLESMAYIAKSHGYATSALHDHRALFYNRNEVYANLGFDTFTSVEYMNNVSFTPTNWCKDSVLTGEIMEIMKSTEERDMMHIISVEGHGAYPTEQVFKNPYTTVTCDDEDTKWKYEYYLNECHEMDTFIGNLIDEINKADEPTVMIIYGDHIPALDVKEENYKLDNLYETRYVIWDNIGLSKKDRDIASYQSGAILLRDAGLAHEGILFDYQQSVKESDPDYLDDMEAIAYDMLYGKNYVFGGSSPYEPMDMKMGHKDISIKEIRKIGDRYYISGQNFTERSIISLRGKQLSTVYLSPTLLALNEKVDPEDIEKLEVSQVDKSEEEILTTVGTNEEL